MSDARDHKRINRFSMPSAFVAAIEAGTWLQPSDDVWSRVIPFLDTPFDLLSLESIHSNNWHTNCPFENESLTPEELEIWKMDEACFRMYRSSYCVPNGPDDLPWLDIDQAIVFATCRYHGDDTALYMDFRSSLEDPRVVAPDFRLGDGDEFLYGWRVVTQTFSEFCEKLGLSSAGK